MTSSTWRSLSNSPKACCEIPIAAGELARFAAEASTWRVAESAPRTGAEKTELPLGRPRSERASRSHARPPFVAALSRPMGTSIAMTTGASGSARTSRKVVTIRRVTAPGEPSHRTTTQPPWQPSTPATHRPVTDDRVAVASLDDRHSRAPACGTPSFRRTLGRCSVRSVANRWTSSTVPSSAPPARCTSADIFTTRSPRSSSPGVAPGDLTRSTGEGSGSALAAGFLRQPICNMFAAQRAENT